MSDSYFQRPWPLLNPWFGSAVLNFFPLTLVLQGFLSTVIDNVSQTLAVFWEKPTDRGPSVIIDVDFPLYCRACVRSTGLPAVSCGAVEDSMRMQVVKITDKCWMSERQMYLLTCGFLQKHAWNLLWNPRTYVFWSLCTLSISSYFWDISEPRMLTIAQVNIIPKFCDFWTKPKKVVYLDFSTFSPTRLWYRRAFVPNFGCDKESN